MARVSDLYQERVRSINAVLFFIVSMSLLSGETVPTAYQKLGRGKCPFLGHAKFAIMPHPCTNKVGRCPAVAQEGRGRGCRAQVELADTL